MSVQNLSKLQISAVKKMAQSLIPLQNNVIRTTTKMTEYAKAKQDEFTLKMDEFKAIIAQNEEEINNINLAITTYTGGITLQEIMHPEANIEADAVNVEEVDMEATADMQQILPPVEDEAPEAVVEEANQEVISTEGPSI